ncbi:MAG TPA: XamI family restriction endonuclease [Gemmatimonadales bacterium]|nr:XamI family restriction endonuclease [Gemmatimonadales bacterium]
MQEPLEQYLNAFDDYQGVVEELLETTVDLTQLNDTALEVLCDSRLALALRYLAGPMISEDDLKTLADAALTPKRLRSQPEMVSRIVEVILAGLDRRRFLWMPEQREPTEHERAAAILATASLIAHSRTNTGRRNEGKTNQEKAVEERLAAAGLVKVKRRHITTLRQAPEPGEFCLESKLGTRKADLIATAWDGRVVPIECKVSNSATNSVKRLNNDAAVKAGSWHKDFGSTQVIPVAVLSGVYKLHNLTDAQARGLTLIWAHHLDPLVDWLLSTRR